MNESQPSTVVTGKGPHISVWIISRISALCLESFFIFLENFPLMQSIHCSKFENSNGGRIDAFTKHSILPLEIWPKRQCHNFDEIQSIRLRFFVTFSYEEEFLFLELATFTFSDNESKYILSYRKARPTHSLLNCISHLPSPK